MHTVHEAVVRAAPGVIFALAADVERWPTLSPAYRWCRTLERDAHRRIFEMAGRIRGLPVRWTATQECYPAEGRIIFRHIRGITTGMVVEWRFTADPAGVRVTLTHDLVMQWPLIGRVVSDVIVGPVFIDWIATQTIQRVKLLAETG